MQPASTSQTLHGEDVAALHFDAEDETRVHDASVHDHCTGAAIAVVAALLRSGQTEKIPEALKQALPRFAQELRRFSIYGRAYVNSFKHDVHSPLLFERRLRARVRSGLRTDAGDRQHRRACR